ncbi:aminoglycoside phosphotransferase family protein [Anabaena sp. FACHB-1237]|uniref:aminoglycoside phosphotransferase family protein n=1 Tax=Anabaena sp. FACHB-1237 TaxID=2692769 RepID=UPI0016811D8D|nr:aminoglycoside phosphotransferase family protein [Anabaena sp. FACHB-1237]MBD2139211.1 aminoglycoside phosphotransferase family protein [Anabaena sp. FACHB-1237]
MLLLLSSQNVIQYLQKSGLCSLEDQAVYKSMLPETQGKNRNLLVNLAGDSASADLSIRQLLVKQEQQNSNIYNCQEFFNEWLFNQLLQQFPELGNIGEITSSLIHFDPENSILVRKYLSEYIELNKFYQHSSIFGNVFDSEIAIAIGTTLAELHRTTFNQKEYRDFMSTAPQGQYRYNFYNPAQGIEIITPDTFSIIPTEGWQFYLEYQQNERIESAIADLSYQWKPCCLTHNDLHLSNILIHSRWQQLDNCLIKIIDWEGCAWGDPAYDLGTLLASYLHIWLSSLVVDITLDIGESLELAIIPLETIQPTIIALIRAYLETFPNILEERRDLMLHIIQFTGLALIHRINHSITQQKYFDNTHLAMLEIAKNLLTIPEKSILNIFGISATEILQPITNLHSLEKLPQIHKKAQLIPIFPQKTRLRGC